MNYESFEQMIEKIVEKTIDHCIEKLVNAATDKERFVDIPTIATFSAVSRPTVRGWIARDYFPLPAYRVGRDFKIKLREFEEWFEQFRLVREPRVQRIGEYRRVK
jgi:excisionase family DNA binding protein